MRSARARPPGRSSASSTSTATPTSRRRNAAASPAGPPPTTTARFPATPSATAELRGPLVHERVDAFLGILGAHDVGDRAGLELHLRLERLDEALVEEALGETVSTRRPRGELARERVGHLVHLCVRNDARDDP